MIPRSEVGGLARASSADAATLVTEKRGSMEKIASMRNCTSGSSSMTTRIFPPDVGASTPSLRTLASPLVIGFASLGSVGPPESLHLLLQLDHLERTVDGHSLEPLEFCEPRLLVAMLLGDLFLGMHLFGHRGRQLQHQVPFRLRRGGPRRCTEPR